MRASITSGARASPKGATIMVKEVRSPWSSEGNIRPTEAPGRSPLSSRADRLGGHIARFTGKGITPPNLMRRDSDLSLKTSNAKFPPGDNRFR
jgi:hypothetical protein